MALGPHRGIAFDGPASAPAGAERGWPVPPKAARLASKGDEMTATILGKIAVAAGLAIITLGVYPDRLRGGMLAIGIAIAAAFVLHFAAP